MLMSLRIPRFPVLIGACGILVFTSGCQKDSSSTQSQKNVLKPILVTEAVKWDTDDPAIWINPQNLSKSLIIGTDKDSDGALYVFDLDGKIIQEKTVRGLKRPNNVDVEYGLLLGGKPVDIAVATERETNKLRVYRLPEMVAIDNGGIDVFTGEAARDPMGIALYKRPKDGAIFAIVSRKSGPQEGYLWQYLPGQRQGQRSGREGPRIRSL